MNNNNNQIKAIGVGWGEQLFRYLFWTICAVLFLKYARNIMSD